MLVLDAKGSNSSTESRAGNWVFPPPVRLADRELVACDARLSLRPRTARYCDSPSTEVTGVMGHRVEEVDPERVYARFREPVDLVVVLALLLNTLGSTLTSIGGG